jgi:hypothetical protein
MDDIMKRLQALDLGGMIIGGALLVALISMFFNWWTFSYSGATGFPGGSGGEAGFHGWGILYFIILLALAAFWVMVMVARSNPMGTLPVSDKAVFMLGGAVMVLVMLIALVSNPYDGAPIGSAGIGFGWFVALLAAIGVLGGGFLTTQESNPSGWNPLNSSSAASDWQNKLNASTGSGSAPSAPPPSAPAPAPATPVESAPSPDSTADSGDGSASS